MSNGEYNVFRYKGYTRPLSIFQLKAMSRKKFMYIGVKKMKGMLTPTGTVVYTYMHMCNVSHSCVVVTL